MSLTEKREIVGRPWRWYGVAIAFAVSITTVIVSGLFGLLDPVFSVNIRNDSGKAIEAIQFDFGNTDMTGLLLAVADIILNHKDPVETLVYWCRKYPAMGYGDRFVKWFDLPWQEPYNSFGNGAAMRVSPAALLAKTLDEALTNADRVTEITHNHPEGMKGARATVQAIFLARLGVAAHDIRSTITLNYGYDLSRSVNDIRDDYSFYESCQKTVPQALTLSLIHI